MVRARDARVLRRTRDLTYRIVIGAFRALFVLLGIRLEIRGWQHVPRGGGAVLASNHIGYLDFAFVEQAASLQGRLVRFMAKRSTFDNPVSGPFMRAMGHIPVDRKAGASAYRMAERAVRRGEVVGLFPEATISRAWTLKPFKPGAAALAVREQVPLVPMVVWGGHRIWTVDGRRSLRRGTPVTVLVGEPINAPQIADVGAVDRELRRRMKDLLDLAQMEYPAYPRSRKDRWWLPLHLGGSAPTPQDAALIDADAVRRADAVSERVR